MFVVDLVTEEVIEEYEQVIKVQISIQIEGSLQDPKSRIVVYNRSKVHFICHFTLT